MTFARVNAPSLAPINLGTVVENAFSSLEIQENIHIGKNLDPYLQEVIADAAQIERVVSNLVMNSQEAMPEGGELTISTRSVDGFAELAVSDTGSGITDEDMKKIFEPLFTTKPESTEGRPWGQPLKKPAGAPLNLG